MVFHGFLMFHESLSAPAIILFQAAVCPPIGWNHRNSLTHKMHPEALVSTLKPTTPVVRRNPILVNFVVTLAWQTLAVWHQRKKKQHETMISNGPTSFSHLPFFGCRNTHQCIPTRWAHWLSHAWMRWGGEQAMESGHPRFSTANLLHLRCQGACVAQFMMTQSKGGLFSPWISPKFGDFFWAEYWQDIPDERNDDPEVWAVFPWQF